MEARAKARYVRVTPRKARRVVDLIRGMPADQAQAALAFAPQSASDPVGKVLASAIANAVRHSLDAMGAEAVAADVEPCARPEFGDWSTPAALRAARVLKRSPQVIADASGVDNPDLIHPGQVLTIP